MIQVRTEQEIQWLAKDKRYYGRERLSYMKVTGREVRGMISRLGIESVLELGPYQVPLVEGSDVMDRDVTRCGRLPGGVWNESDREFELAIEHDARRCPWPIPLKSYDLFIALQVFEHLSPFQPQAFQEVRRIARHAIISLPIGWKGEDEIHRGITPEMALEWFAPVKPTRVVMGNGGARARYVYVFEGLGGL